ncbi:MAG: cellulase family glycosylhydrolase [Acidobacteriaceae bacterium]|nr:cellulase family glycosylhydrolase [Acidobacteriaceae bacterium]
MTRKLPATAVLSSLLLLPLTQSAQSQEMKPAVPAARIINADVRAAKQPVDRFFALSVGSDYPGTLRRAEDQEQLKLVVKELGFRYLRFHDIFDDVLGTVHKTDHGVTYDWKGIDALYDQLLGKGIKPFVELGFTPSALKTSDQTIFYWKGNTSHPQRDGWNSLITAFVTHLEARYGKAEVRSWFFEVWNEPNLAGFWEGADQAAYFQLFDDTSNAIKAVDPSLRVGGPATAGGAWPDAFLAHVKKSGAKVDFLSTHTYGVDGGFLDENGVADTKLSTSPDAVLGDVRNTRKQVEASAYPGLPIYFTEWSTSYTDRDPVHDAYVSAPYILTKLKGAQGYVQGMSYWTYTDLFEEPGPPPSSFHGGFGLLNREGIRKPAFFAYKYLNALQGLAVPVADSAAMIAKEGDDVHAVIWSFELPDQHESDHPYYTRVHPSHAVAPVSVNLEHMQPKETYSVEIHRTGFHANDAYSAYLEMGAPKDLSPAQVQKLNALTADKPESRKSLVADAAGTLHVDFPMNSNDVVQLIVTPLQEASAKNKIGAGRQVKN